jgi:type II secretory pathway component PulM
MGNRPTSSRPPHQGWLKTLWGRRMILGSIILALAAYLVLETAVRPLLAARTEALASIARSELIRSRLADPTRVWQDDREGDEPVSAVVTKTAAAHGLTIRRIEPAGGEAKLLIENADFNEVITWIAELEIEQGLRVVTLDVNRTTDPGFVDATMAVRR